MSIRPIDLTVSVQRSVEVHRSENGVGRPDVAQQHFASELQKQVENDDRAVNKRNKSEESDVNKDCNGQGGASGGSSRDKKREKNEPEVKYIADGDSMLDISV